MSEGTESDRYEEFEQTLDPHRREERRRVRAEAIDHLQGRGVHITGAETDEEIAELVDAVDRFEHEVEVHGGDLMVDTGYASEPDDPIFLLPKRLDHERVAAYLGRIDTATQRVHRR